MICPSGVKLFLQLRRNVDDCLEWKEIGLSPPQAVIDATTAYLETEDTIATWIEERCECGKSYRDTSGNLYASWKSWAELNGEFVGSQKTFSEKLQAREGIEKTKLGDKKTRGYRGIWVIKDVEPTRSYQDD